MERFVVKKEALGRVAGLGDLYNAQNDAFCGASVYNHNTLIKSKFSQPIDSETVHLLESIPLSEKYSQFIKDPDLQLSVLAGLVPLIGSSEFLAETKTSNLVSHSLLLSIKTKRDKLFLPDQNLNETLAIPAIRSSGATHVVVGIQWGANTVISVSYDNANILNNPEFVFEEKDLSKFSLLEHIDRLCWLCSQTTKYDLNWYIDVLPNNQNPPHKIQEALPYFRKIQHVIKEETGKHAIPLLYHLLPIDKFLDVQFPDKSFHFVLPKANSNCATNLLFHNFYSQLQLAEQRLSSFYANGKKYACLQLQEIETIARNKYFLEIYHSSFQKNFVKALIQTRKGETSVSHMQRLLDNYTINDNFSPTNLLQSMNLWTSMETKIQFVKLILSKGANYIGWYGSLENEMASIEQGQCFVFYFSENTMRKNMDQWFYSKHRFLRLLKEKAGKSVAFCKLIAVDCDINPGYTPVNFKFPFIQLYQRENGITKNCLVYDTSDKQLPLTYAITVPILDFIKPVRKIRFSVPCSGENCNLAKNFEWKCAECMESLDYGFDQHVYCVCGKTSVFGLQFKCTDKLHGVEFKQHHESDLLKHLASLQPPTTINILLLGETGVGKSTWINALINYIQYETLNEASESHLFTLVASKITHYNDKSEEIEVITTTTDNNEKFVTGQSATQQARCYPIEINNMMYNIIDTPGIGDTRGYEQDSRNFENILNVLSNFEVVHGICILLKPNNARLNVTFRFCIKELLTYLHKDASKNLLYCFTNCRATSFRPGETLPALKTLLREANMEIGPEQIYCFDSESYRFLAGINNSRPIDFKIDEVVNFGESWTKSRNETMRMIKYICKLPPHPLQSTINLNYCRQLVLQLPRPLTEITQVIETNKANLEMEIKYIMSNNCTMELLEQQRFVTRTVMHTQKMKYPKTVCKNAACTTICKEGIMYQRTCHDVCKLLGAKYDSVGSLMLFACKIIQLPTGICKVCNHSYKDHQHLFYESILIQKSFEDISITRELRVCNNTQEAMINIITNKERQIEEFMNELNIIQEAFICFLEFLTRNSIASYNDATAQYLTHCILEEEDKVRQQKGNEKVVENLRNHLKLYEENKKILHERLQQQPYTNSVPPGVNVVQGKIEQLKSLKYCGRDLKSALECVEYAQQATNDFIYEKGKKYVESVRCKNT